MLWNSHLVEEGTAKGKMYEHILKLCWISCFCVRRAVESQPGVRLSPAAFPSAPYKLSQGSWISSTCKTFTMEHSERFEQRKETSSQCVTENNKETANKALKNNYAVAIEVVGEGTRLMKAIKFPTLIIKFRNRDLRRSKVYYATLEVDSTKYSGEIPAVLFTSHHYSERTEFAELLPLLIGKSKQIPGFGLKPMLHSKRWKRIFKKGCSLKVKALEGGRVVNWLEEYPWNVYDLRLKELRGLLKRIVSQDIREMPLEMIEALVVRNEAMRKYKRYTEKENLSEFIIDRIDEKLVGYRKE